MTKSNWLRDFLTDVGEWFLDGFEGRFWYVFIGGLITVIVQVLATEQYSIASVVNSLMIVLPLTYFLVEIMHGNTTPFLGISSSKINNLLLGFAVFIWISIGYVIVPLTVSHGNKLLGGWFF
jgi:hypothetical protein